MILKLIIFFLFILYCLGFIYIYFLKRKYNKQKKDLGKILLAVKRVRYGDINVRVGKLFDVNLENTINRLLETIYDREMMIKEYQNALSKKNLSLEEILNQEKQLRLFKEEFTATLTHDMKVPVIAELNSLNYLLEGRFGELNAKQKEVLNLMKSSNSELKELIENMLDIYKLEQHKLQLNPTENDINDFIISILKEVEPLALEGQHYINSDLSKTENLTLIFDTFQMKRVIKNLLQNAFSFSRNGEEVKIETDINNEKVQISVINKGVGISEEELELIFQKYYSGSSKFRKSGTGLGLYLSKQIMNAHNGNITADCSQQGYTKFTVSLPVKMSEKNSRY